MTDKEILQNNLIELIEDWIERGKPLGLSNARNMINEYENEQNKRHLQLVRNFQACR